MIAVGLVFTVLAALLHVYIFWMESLAWDGPQARKTFGVPDAEREATRAFAFNQGFYNLFLAAGAVLGVILWIAGHEVAGRTLALFCTASMVLAASVLLTTGRTYLQAALTQGTLPLIGFVLALAAS